MTTRYVEILKFMAIKLIFKKIKIENLIIIYAFLVSYLQQQQLPRDS